MTQIDSAVKYKMGFPMGIFELADYTGLDVIFKATSEMYSRDNKIVNPHPKIKELVDAQNFGQKTGKGFYEYSGSTYERVSLTPEEAAKYNPIGLAAISANNAGWLISNGVCTKEDVDKALRLGMGLKTDLFSTVETFGVLNVVEKLRGHVLAGNRLPTVWVPDQQTRDDRELVRARVELGEKQTQVKSQIQMLLKRHGVEKASGLGAGWTVRYRRWLEALTESEPLGRGGRQTLGSLLRQLSFIEGEIERMQQPVERLADEPRHKPIVDELRQECGVGLLTAMVYRTEIGYAGRFRRGRQTGKYVGLTPTSYESGEQNDRKGHISRQGPPRLRKMLCQASWSQVCHDVSAKRIYQQLVSRNPKKKKIAIVAVMRRLAVRLWHRMRKVEVEMGLA